MIFPRPSAVLDDRDRAEGGPRVVHQKDPLAQKREPKRHSHLSIGDMTPTLYADKPPIRRRGVQWALGIANVGLSGLAIFYVYAALVRMTYEGQCYNFDGGWPCTFEEHSRDFSGWFHGLWVVYYPLTLVAVCVLMTLNWLAYRAVRAVLEAMGRPSRSA